MWQTESRLLSNRIAGLLEGGKFVLETAKAGESDHFGVTSELIHHARRIVDDLERLGGRHGEALPVPAQVLLREFIQYFRKTFERAVEWTGIQGTLTALASFRAEFDFLLADSEVVARSLVDRAFIHLNRSLVMNSDLRRLWREALEAGEPAIEGLGAVHLLSFGVWAFKVSGTGERTDLVMGTPLTDMGPVGKAAEALVLTEWKIVRDSRQARAAFDQAFAQARRYAVGVLGGLELASRRYMVLVSTDRLELPPAREEGSVTYEPVNIAIDPTTPSRARLAKAE